MSNVVLTWQDPTVKAGIDHIIVAASVDGENFSAIAEVLPGVQTLTDQDVQPGKWFYEVTVVPKSGAISDPVRGSIDVPFPKAGSVTNLQIVLS